MRQCIQTHCDGEKYKTDTAAFSPFDDTCSDSNNASTGWGAIYSHFLFVGMSTLYISIPVSSAGGGPVKLLKFVNAI
jgi:hypothetical protein